MSEAGDALEDLPEDARERLEAFTRALERVHVDDLPLYVARRREPRHRRAVETAELIAIENGVDAAVRAARHAVIDGVLREFAAAQLRVSYAGVNSVGGGGPVEERVRILESLGEAVTAIVLDDRIDAADHGELLGLWERLLP